MTATRTSEATVLPAAASPDEPRETRRVAYLVNQYPKISHAFIRREIAALEKLGVRVDRFSVRGSPEALVDAEDVSEARRTNVLLEHGPLGLLGAMAREAARSPVRFAKSLALTVKTGLGSDRGLVHNVAYLGEACVLRERLRAVECEHLHAHFGTNSATVAMLCHELGGPSYSFTVHGPEEFDKPEALRLREKIERSSFVVAVSSFGRSQLFRHAPHGHWRKVRVVRCGVDAAFLDATPTPVPDVPRLACVGRLCEQKGQMLLVEAVADLADAGVPIELVLVGDGEHRAPIEALVARRNLGDRVRITGWADGATIRRELEASRALVLPSFAEGLPVVIMEALALGRPVLSTYVAGIPELVAEGVCGFLVPAGSKDDLAAALRKVLETDAVTLTRMGRAGRERVKAMHDIDVCASGLNAAFDALEPT